MQNLKIDSNLNNKQIAFNLDAITKKDLKFVVFKFQPIVVYQQIRNLFFCVL